MTNTYDQIIPHIYRTSGGKPLEEQELVDWAIALTERSSSSVTNRYIGSIVHAVAPDGTHHYFGAANIELPLSAKSDGNLKPASHAENGAVHDGLTMMRAGFKISDVYLASPFHDPAIFPCCECRGTINGFSPSAQGTVDAETNVHRIDVKNRKILDSHPISFLLPHDLTSPRSDNHASETISPDRLLRVTDKPLEEAELNTWLRDIVPHSQDILSNIKSAAIAHAKVGSQHIYAASVGFELRGYHNSSPLRAAIQTAQTAVGGGLEFSDYYLARTSGKQEKISGLSDELLPFDRAYAEKFAAEKGAYLHPLDMQANTFRHAKLPAKRATQLG